jgi:hypothetical protein
VLLGSQQGEEASAETPADCPSETVHPTVGVEPKAEPVRQLEPPQAQRIEERISVPSRPHSPKPVLQRTLERFPERQPERQFEQQPERVALPNDRLPDVVSVRVPGRTIEAAPMQVAGSPHGPPCGINSSKIFVKLSETIPELKKFNLDIRPVD